MSAQPTITSLSGSRLDTTSERWRLAHLSLTGLQRQTVLTRWIIRRRLHVEDILDQQSLCHQAHHSVNDNGHYTLCVIRRNRTDVI